MRYLAFLPAAVCLTLFACSGHDESSDGDDGAPDETLVESTSSALVATDPVSAAIAAGCSTLPVKPLITQILAELECLRPNTMKRIDNTPGIKLNGADTLPYLQKAAADALIAAQKARGVTIGVNSGLRTIVEQYMLNRFFDKGCPDLFQPAAPGQSNHESGLAIDIESNAAWRSALQNQGFVWLGAFDPVHYDFKGAGTVPLVGLGVKSFQRLWNRNHPNELLDEDGAYGPMTEQRINQAPIGGFAKGPLPNCGAPVDAGPPDGAPSPVEPSPPAEAGPSEEGTSPEESSSGSSSVGPSAPEANDGGCSVTAGPDRAASPTRALAMVGVVALAAALRRRRRET